MFNFLLIADEHRECSNWKLFKDYHRKNLMNAYKEFLDISSDDSRYLVHLGDMVHSYKPLPDNSDPRGLNTIIEAYEDFTKPIFVPIFLDGNHENRHGLYTGPTIPEHLQRFTDLKWSDVEYHPEDRSYTLTDEEHDELVAVASGYPKWGQNSKNIQDDYRTILSRVSKGKSPRILFTHVPINGITVGSYEVNTNFTVEAIREIFSDDTVIFSGDIHKAQIYNGVHYVGSPYDTRSRETVEDIVNLLSTDWLEPLKDVLPTFTIVSYNPETKKVESTRIPAKFKCLDILGSIEIDKALHSISDLESYLISQVLPNAPETLKLKAKVNIKMDARNKELFYSKGEAVDVTAGILSQHTNILMADTSVTFGTFVDGIFLMEEQSVPIQETVVCESSRDIVTNPQEQFYEYKHSVSRKFSQETWGRIEAEVLKK